MTSASICRSCRYWQRNYTLPDDGVCRRYAPKACQLSDKGHGSFRDEAFMTIWPETHFDEWCGEWEAVKR